MRELTMTNGRVTDARAPDVHDPDAEDVLDLSDAGLVLVCSECHGGNDESPGGAETVPVRKRSDPETVVRCATCGRKHSTDSLRA
jgi:hypothetical protein